MQAWMQTQTDADMHTNEESSSEAFTHPTLISCCTGLYEIELFSSKESCLTVFSLKRAQTHTCTVAMCSLPGSRSAFKGKFDSIWWSGRLPGRLGNQSSIKCCEQIKNIARSLLLACNRVCCCFIVPSLGRANKVNSPPQPKKEKH